MNHSPIFIFAPEKNNVHSSPRHRCFSSSCVARLGPRQVDAKGRCRRSTTGFTSCARTVSTRGQNQSRQSGRSAKNRATIFPIWSPGSLIPRRKSTTPKSPWNIPSAPSHSILKMPSTHYCRLPCVTANSRLYSDTRDKVKYSRLVWDGNPACTGSGSKLCLGPRCAWTLELRGGGGQWRFKIFSVTDL